MVFAQSFGFTVARSLAENFLCFPLVVSLSYNERLLHGG
jgi:hypothetical protein